MLKIGNDWDDILKNELEKSYFLEMKEFLKREYSEKIIYPPKKEIFTAFQLTPYKDVKVVILGQDPYHGEGQAHGLAFSVKKGVKLPPSLRNIYKEIANENEAQVFNHGCLESWATQGVFLLNTSLTVREGEANSHSKIGWSKFTDEVIKKLNEKKEPIIFVLWGNNAKQKKKLITNSQHYILEGVHPSPLSASRGFFGCNHFKEINLILKEKFNKHIDWNII
ncbi:uracil-DNA glycosylase [Cetobacterium sp. 8H]|uniref:uracil-DNA glycosylase n=1 Tax=Cetobacterium sp. 8H TaxID=2759681 RepID=UPI00163D0A6E|nr:uracil-DNA glycosylase [Cetobacterium sp. 8H]MBC2851301.1 uracil-DNA glycosylase [Cetobacterium sp. 8H]